jgi:hypothetical protein
MGMAFLSFHALKEDHRAFLSSLVTVASDRNVDLIQWTAAFQEPLKLALPPEESFRPDMLAKLGPAFALQIVNLLFDVRTR